MLTLYYTPNSPYARKVRVALAEKGLDFKAEVLTARPPAEGRIYPDSYESVNPNLRVPMLVDGKREIWESNLILDYLFKTYPDRQGSGNPPFARALTRPERHWEDMLVLVTIETLLDSALNLFVLVRNGADPSKNAYLGREQQRGQACLDWLEKQAQGFVPGQFSALDLNLACTLTWMDFRKPFEWRGRPTLEKLVARWQERPTLAATRPG